MIIENPRAAMLSNFEVLQLLEEQQAKQKEAQDSSDGISVPENLRTVQFEVCFPVFVPIIKDRARPKNAIPYSNTFIYIS